MMDYGSMMAWYALLSQRQDEEMYRKEHVAGSVRSKRVAARGPRRITWLSLGILPLMIGVIAMHRPRHSTAELRDDTPQVEEPGVDEEAEVEHV